MDILKVEAGLIIWEAIAFVGLFLVLWKFAWGPILGILSERENTIRESVEKAEETRDEAEKLMADYKRQLDEARAEAQKIIEDGRKFGESMKEEIVQKARQESEQVLTKANEAITREKESALAELQSQVADLTIDAASKVVNRSLSKKDHQQLIEEYLAEAGSISDN